MIRGLRPPIVRAERLRAERDAQALLAAAQDEARRAVEHAEAEARTIVARAEADAARLLADARATVERERARLLEASVEDVLRLGLELARRLTRRALAEDARAYRAMAESLVAEARIEGPGWLRVPPGVALTLEGFETVEDAELAPGDVVVETEGARLDGRLDERLAAMGRALTTPKTS